MREVEFTALTDWLADSARAAAGDAEAELAADWSRLVARARWARLSTPASLIVDDGTLRAG